MDHPIMYDYYKIWKETLRLWRKTKFLLISYSTGTIENHLLNSGICSKETIDGFDMLFF